MSQTIALNGKGRNLLALAMALDIADTSSKEAIECHCLLAKAQCEAWWDTDLVGAEDAEFVAEAVECLELRGLLQRHPEYKSLVRWES